MTNITIKLASARNLAKLPNTKKNFVLNAATGQIVTPVTDKATRMAGRLAKFTAAVAAHKAKQAETAALALLAKADALEILEAEIVEALMEAEAMKVLAAAIALGEVAAVTNPEVDGREASINTAAAGVAAKGTAPTYGTILARLLTNETPKLLAFGISKEADAKAAGGDLHALIASLGGVVSADSLLVPTTGAIPEGADSDEYKAGMVSSILKDQAITAIVVDDEAFVGVKAGEAIADAGRAGVTVFYASTLPVLSKVAHMGRKPVTCLEDILKIANSRLEGLGGRMTDKGVVIFDEKFPTTALITVAKDGEHYVIGNRMMSRRNAIVIGNKPFAAGGDTLVMVADADTSLGIAFCVLAQTMANRKGYASNAVYGWLKGIEGMLGSSPLEMRKQSAATRLFNQNNVMGGYTIVETKAGGIYGTSRVNTAGVAGQLAAIVPDAVFLPSAKGDYFITYSATELASQEHAWFITPDGRLGAHCKGTKHTAASYANVGNVVKLPVMIMEKTPFCQGGAMPITDEVMDTVLSMEDKLLYGDEVNYPTTKHLFDARRAGKTCAKVTVGQVITPNRGKKDRNGVLAVVNGKKVLWKAKKANGAYSARITEVKDVEVDVKGQVMVKLVIRAVVTYGGSFKGRGVAKVMAASNNSTGTTMQKRLTDGTFVNFAGAFISGGAFKVTTELVTNRTTGHGKITRAVDMHHLSILVHNYGPGADKPDARFSYDTTAMTVTWEGEVIYATMEMGIESGPVSEGIGGTGVIPTQVSFLTACDAYGDGVGSEVLRDMFTDEDGVDIIERKGKLLAYTKAAASAIVKEVAMPQANGTTKRVTNTGWVSRNADLTVVCPLRAFANVAGEPKLTAQFDIAMSDVEILQTMALHCPKIQVYALDESNNMQSILINSSAVLMLAGGGSESGTLGGLGHVAADLLRCVLFTSFANKVTKRVSLIRKLRKQFFDMAFKSAKLNRIYRHEVGVVAKCTPDWRTAMGDVRVHPNSPWVMRQARLHNCAPQEINGRDVLSGRHPVMAMTVGKIIFDRSVPENVVVVGEDPVRVTLLGDTDGDQLVAIIIKDPAKAARLKAAIAKMLPSGDVKQKVYGISGSSPAAKLFGELPKETETLDGLFDKDVIKSKAAWQKQLDEQALTALGTCGSSYKMGEFAILLAGLKQVSVKGALVAAILYEDFGLAGGVTVMPLKEALKLFNSGIKRKNKDEFRAKLGEALSTEAGDHTVVLDEQSVLDLAVASEFARCAKAGMIPVNAKGESKIDFIGGSGVHVHELWPIVAVLQAMGRGNITQADKLILTLTPEVMDEARAIVGPDNFLIQLVDTIARTLGPVVRELEAMGELGNEETDARGTDDSLLADESREDFEGHGFDPNGLDD